ncbi:UvrD-helicase domain-containing protein [Vibrio diazotrophicus]|uniref:UvrD-helicase domain-containing protein n=1 Tax=Vibrio diazotrophicus TaxID=685 RepID=UPI0005AB036F|nr:UvrD-helicase domain-containing protein [Vibrio diazotrophicus]
MSNRIEEEKQLLQSIFDVVEIGKSFRFSAGAGSGKTYALVECLKYLLKTQVAKLSKNKQQIICITYTNVAVNEIKERLGNSELVIVSTIHEMLWDIIQRYQPELVSIHLDKLKNELEKVDNELENDPDNKLGIFNALLPDERDSYINLVKESKNTYYRNRNSRAAEFKAAYAGYHEYYGESAVKKWQENYGKFKEVAKRVYKKDRYETAIDKIESQEKGYTHVSYDSIFNADRLDKMKFSHDTLIEYSERMVSEYPILRRIIIDKYPFIFVDEYQDAHPLVIKIMKNLHDYSEENNRKWLVGYFGDTAQTIYDDGVGSEIDTLHPKVEVIYKKYNRRSQKQIIDVANIIRNDQIEQEPIFDDKVNGDVRFYYVNNINADTSRIAIAENFVNEFKSSLVKDSEIDCLVLTNRLMAEMNGFGEVYESFREAENIYFDDLNTKLLAHELEKLEPIIRVIYKLLSSYLSIEDSSTTFYDLFGEKGRSISFYDAHSFVKVLKEINPISLSELLAAISDYHLANPHSSCLDIFVRRFLGAKQDEISDYGSIDSLVRGGLRDLMIIRDHDDDILNDLQIDKVNQVLNISIEVWSRWVRYIKKEQSGKIRYHTYHGTKGEEYQNVAIIMEHSFGSGNHGRNKFKKFFEFRGSDEKSRIEALRDEDIRDKIINTQNLVYVACSRAETNLWLIYLDDISDIKNGIESIFNQIELWDKVD